MEHITKPPGHVQEFELPGFNLVDVGIGLGLSGYELDMQCWVGLESLTDRMPIFYVFGS